MLTKSNNICILLISQPSPTNLSLTLLAHLCVHNENKISIDNLGFKAVNILWLIRLRFHKQLAVQRSKPQESCLRHIFTHTCDTHQNKDAVIHQTTEVL